MRLPIRNGRTLLLLVTLACTDDSGTIPDAVAPPDEEPSVGFVVTGVTPAPFGSSVDVRTPVVVTFSQALDSASVQGALTLTRGDLEVRGTLVLDGPRALRFQPSTPLDPGDDWTVGMGASIRSIEGTPVDSAWTWKFRTAGEPLGEPEAGRLAHLVSVLADDSLRGRGSGSTYEARAAEAIAGDLEASGLNPFRSTWLRGFTALTRDVPPAVVGSRNVLGAVAGNGDLAGEWVVVGAHYDHLGFVERSDGTLSVYHGADDNASGTALVMEVARLWASAARGNAGGPRRSVLFALWGAEERGLLGSCFFAASGDLPLERISGVFNFDMVGRLGDRALRVPVAEPDSAWWGVLSDANRTGLTFDSAPACTGCSDHACFQQAARPVVWFYTGSHEDYHKPTDVPQKVDHEGLSRIGGMALRALWRVAVAERAPGG